MSLKLSALGIVLLQKCLKLSGLIFRIIANQNVLHRSWQANKLNEQSELKRAFQLALVLADSEPRVNVTVSIKGKMRQGWRRYTFGYSKDPPKAVQIELCPRTSELASEIEALAAEIARLNTLVVPEHTVPAEIASAGTVPPETAPAAESSAGTNNLPGLLQQQLDI